MDEKAFALDFAVKAANLTRFLKDEKNEHTISSVFFTASSDLSALVYSFKNPALSKADAAQLKKDAALLSNRIVFLLDMLFEMGFISRAQRESVLKTLDALKKNIH